MHLDLTASLTLCSKSSSFCVLILFLLRKHFYQIFLSGEDCFFFSSALFRTHRWADSESREQFAGLTFSPGIRYDLAVVCIYCFSVGGNRHTPWKSLIKFCFQKDLLKGSFFTIYTGDHSLNSSNQHAAFQRHLPIWPLFSIFTPSFSTPQYLDSVICWIIAIAPYTSLLFQY